MSFGSIFRQVEWTERVSLNSRAQARMNREKKRKIIHTVWKRGFHLNNSAAPSSATETHKKRQEKKKRKRKLEQTNTERRKNNTKIINVSYHHYPDAFDSPWIYVCLVGSHSWFCVVIFTNCRTIDERVKFVTLLSQLWIGCLIEHKKFFSHRFVLCVELITVISVAIIA